MCRVVLGEAGVFFTRRSPRWRELVAFPGELAGVKTSIHADRREGIGWRILARKLEQPAYQLRLARTMSDVRAAQALRFNVFNLELNEGLDESYLTGLDADRFDAICDHLLVEMAGHVVGTYRLQSGALAGSHCGYYSEGEFDFAPFEPLREEIIELGRACVHPEHRNIAVLGLLWQGIAAYARQRDCRYLIGCSSLTSQEPRDGAAVYSQLMRRHSPAPELRTRPWPAYECPLTELAERPPRVPKLLSAYLSIGAKICAPPAIDRQFRTIDFLTLLDLDSLPPAAAGLIG
jgi:putative hemolysin